MIIIIDKQYRRKCLYFVIRNTQNIEKYKNRILKFGNNIITYMLSEIYMRKNGTYLCMQKI